MVGRQMEALAGPACPDTASCEPYPVFVRPLVSKVRTTYSKKEGETIETIDCDKQAE